MFSLKKKFLRKGKMLAAILVAFAACGALSGCGAKGDAVLSNYQTPAGDEKVAVLHVADYGDIVVKLFPDLVPKAVGNFEGLIDMDYYDNLTFHRVIKGFMIQGGDPRGDGTGGSSVWGDRFDAEISSELHHFTGAVSYANTGSLKEANGSQFFIVTSGDPPSEGDLAGYDFPEDVKEKYMEVGGAPHLDGRHTVFGQVVQGQEVADAISKKVVTDGNDKPKQPVVIESVSLVPWEEVKDSGDETASSQP